MARILSGLFIIIGLIILAMATNSAYRVLSTTDRTSERELYRVSLVPVRLRAYISGLESALDDNPEISNDEFLKVIRRRELVEDFFDSHGYWKGYTVRVCSSKEAWLAALRNRTRLPLVIVVAHQHDNRDEKIGEFTYDTQPAMVGATTEALMYIDLW